MATIPASIAIYNLAWGASASARSFASVNVTAGALCTVATGSSNAITLPFTVAKASGTATISSIVATQSFGTSGASCGSALHTFTIVTGGTLVISVLSSDATHSFVSDLVVATGSTGFTSQIHTASSTLVQSLTASAGSCVFAALVEWNAVATNTTAWTPAAAVEDYAMTDGVSHQATAGSQGSAFQAHWTNVADGAVSYGLTAPAAQSFQIIVWEILGTASCPSIIKQQAVNRSYTY